jgi:hypothetical protein
LFKLLHPGVRAVSEQTVVDVLLDYLRDDMKLWVKNVKQNDLITAKEMMELGVLRAEAAAIIYRSGGFDATSIRRDVPAGDSAAGLMQTPY